jgi:DNA-binding NarL/FixJ family response regulator
MLTSTDDQREINRSYQLGANGYIIKPVSYEDFQRRVKALGMYLDIVCLPR